MKIKYVSVFARNIEEEIDFLTNKLGFVVKNTLYLQEGVKAILVESGSDEEGVLKLVVIDKYSLQDNRTVVVLNTMDCIRSYHQLKASGVYFAKSPVYTETGMSAKFEDPSGNIYMLLEERDYKENHAI